MGIPIVCIVCARDSQEEDLFNFTEDGPICLDCSGEDSEENDPQQEEEELPGCSVDY